MKKRGVESLFMKKIQSQYVICNLWQRLAVVVICFDLGIWAYGKEWAYWEYAKGAYVMGL